MTIIEVFLCGAWLLFATAVGASVGARGGWVPGVLAAALALWLFPVGLQGSATLLSVWRPRRPVCRRGKCGCDDYSLITVCEAGGLYRCRCNDLYWRARRGGDGQQRFVLVCSTGVVEPYRVRTRLGTWRADACLPSALVLPTVLDEARRELHEAS